MTISLRELAKVCGLSISTVSKALNGYEDVNPDTKAFVLKTAREMGYFPNAMARALKTGKTLNLGVLFVDDSESGLTHTYFAGVLESFKREAEKRGYDITFINHNIGNQTMSYLEHCRYRKVDGVCLACINFNDPDVIALANSEIPTVTIDHVYDSCSCVLSENRLGMRDLVRHVYGLGHRKIGYIHGLESYVTQMRVDSYRQMLTELELPVREDYMIACPYQSPIASREATVKMLSLPEPPTCLLMPDDFAALGGFEGVRDKGLSVPSDVSIIGYDGTKLLQRFSPKLTTLAQDTNRIGGEAARLLVEHIESPRAAAQTVIVNGKLLVGETAAPPRSA